MSKQISRRGYVKYAAAGVVVVGGAATGVYYFTRPKLTPSPTESYNPTETPSPTSQATPINHPPTAIFRIKPQYILPATNQDIEFINLTEDIDDDPLTYSWFVDGQVVSEKKDYSTRLSDGDHTIGLAVSDGRLADLTQKELTVEPDQFYPKKGLKVPIKGIGYKIGIPAWLENVVPVSRMDDDLTILHDELGCNGIRIESSFNEQLIKCGEIAINKGFDYISLNSRYIDASWDVWINKIKDLAPEAEKLRRRSDAIVLQPATEFCVDSKAVFKHDTYTERSANLAIDMKNNPSWHNQFMEYLKKLIHISREYFNGEITYNEAWWEGVKWRELDVDIIGTNQWFDPHRAESVETSLRRIIKLGKKIGKQVIASEFGSASYEGACELGYTWSKTGPYSEDAQADCIERYLKIYNDLEPHGCFLVYYYEPTHTWRSREQTFSIMKPELPTTDHVLSRKKSFYMYESYQRSS